MVKACGGVRTNVARTTSPREVFLPLVVCPHAPTRPGLAGADSPNDAMLS
jgi:hypothetical protein